MPEQNRYEALISRIFRNHHEKGMESFEFDRKELETVASEMKIALPKNLGDLIYSFRYRNELPAGINATATGKKTWIIASAGRGKYRFQLTATSRIAPRTDLIAIKIPDATPEIVSRHALGDEQALLAKVRYNRLIDVFLGIATYSLQNHLRTISTGVNAETAPSN